MHECRYTPSSWGQDEYGLTVRSHKGIIKTMWRFPLALAALIALSLSTHAALDNDGVANANDAFPLNADEWSDLDRDGTGDNSDYDLEGDGIANRYESALSYDPYDAQNTPPDQDRDGIPNKLDKDRDDDGYKNEIDVFPDDSTEWADFDGDGIGNNRDTDVDGDGFKNSVEVQYGTDPWDKSDYPDYNAPVIGGVEWLHEQKMLSGMAFDDGRGIRSLHLESATGGRCDGFVSYPGHFLVPCHSIESDSEWVLVIADVTGNHTRKAVNFE